MGRILIGFLKILGNIPLGGLYVISDLLYFIFRFVIQYRRDVIIANLKNSFPSWSSEQVNATADDYYRYLCDVVVESIHLQKIDRRALLDRVVFNNPEHLQLFEKEGSKVIIMMGHSGNWEWAGLATAARFQFQMLPVYRRIKDPSIDGFMRILRSRFNAHPILDKEIFDEIQSIKHPHAIALLADQTPAGDKGLWLNFLNQDTPFYRGAEILVYKKGYKVVFAHVFKQKRGHYRIDLSPYNPANDSIGEITAAFALFLEERIKEQPSNWLWSHKRWKHKATPKSRRYLKN